jgi:CRISPR-associated protein Cas1
MMSLPDFREKQILCVRANRDMENRLQFSNENIVFAQDGKKINQISCYKVFAVFIIGDFSLTSVLIRNCHKYGIAIFLLKDNFECYGVVGSVLAGNYLLREKQYSEVRGFEIAKKIVKNKITNQYSLLKEAGLTEGIDLARALSQADEAMDNQELLGVEGNFSKTFFQKYFKELGWKRRMPRTKFDINNVVLDIGYTFLFNFIDSLLNLYGFDTYRGFYHKLFFQRKSLACDLMEPFRCLVDKQILKSFHLKQFKLEDFVVVNGRYALSYDKQREYMAIFLDCLMDRKEDLFKYIKNFYYWIMKGEGEPPEFNI